MDLQDGDVAEAIKEISEQGKHAKDGLCDVARDFEAAAEIASELREEAKERIGWTGCE